MTLRRAKLRAAVAELQTHLSTGKTDEQARTAMCLSEKQYDRVKDALYGSLGTELREKTTEQVYVDYVLAQQACIDDLAATRCVGFNICANHWRQFNQATASASQARWMVQRSAAGS